MPLKILIYSIIDSYIHLKKLFKKLKYFIYVLVLFIMILVIFINKKIGQLNLILYQTTFNLFLMNFNRHIKSFAFYTNSSFDAYYFLEIFSNYPNLIIIDIYH